MPKAELGLASIVEYSGDAITSGTLEGVIIGWNSGAERLYGYPANEAIGRTVWDVMGPLEGSDLVVRNIDKIKRGEVVGSFDTVHHTRDGRPLHVSVTLSPIKGPTDEVVGVLAINRDISEHKKAEEALHASETRFRTVIEQSPLSIHVFTPDGRSLRVNESWNELWNLGEGEEPEGTNVFEDEKLRDTRLTAYVEKSIADSHLVNTPSLHYEPARIGREGDPRWLQASVYPVRGEAGSMIEMVLVIEDVTERKHAEEALKESEERFRGTFEDAPIGMALVSLDRRYLRVNRAFCEMLGYSEEELLAKTSLVITHPDDLQASAERTRRALEEGDGSHVLEKRYIHADGHMVWSLSSVSLVRDSQGDPNHFVAMFEDISERKALEEQLRHRAFHDPLTDLPNRALFMNRLEHALSRLGRREEPIAVLFVDLNDFKSVNDSLGHEAGDDLLTEVAGRLKKCVRPEDTVARLGGDEFTVLLEGISHRDGAARAAERILEVLQEPFDLRGQEVFTGASIGITLVFTASEKPEDVLKNADLALYDAKKKGKAHYEFFEEEMSEQLRERLKLERDLRRAIEREEFRIYYQPKISIETGEIVSLEALVRWEHPERGLLEPDDFLAVAEGSGLIVQLGEWVLDEVCRQGRAWQERYSGHSPPRVCTNVSPKQFLRTNLVPRVIEALQKSGLRSGGLSLEVPESVLMEEAEANAEKLKALKELGIHIVIDDFGTAYSSLAHLKNFPVNILKIDRSLTLNLGEEPEDNAIVSAMIGLAKALGWAVTAQGVETEEQLELLRELGCDIVQGYYFTRPVTSEEATELLESNLLMQH